MASGPQTGNHQQQPTLGRRAYQRARMHLRAHLISTTRTYQVTLRNLSASGAMVEGPDLPPVGKTAILQRQAIDVLTTVIWGGDGQCGLEFDEEIDMAEVIKQLRSPPEPTFAATRNFYWRLREGSDRISAEEWEAARAWASKSGMISKS